MTRVFLATVLFAAALAPTVTAQQDDTPVVSTIADTNPAAAPSLQIRSDGLGSYIHKPRYLSSVIQPIGDWELDLGMIVTRGSGRRVYLNFEQPVQGSGLSGGAPIAPPSQQYVVRFITKCYSVNENMWLVPAGQQITCPMFINFDDYNGNHFRVQMSRAAAASSDEPNVTCTTIGADGRCAGWTIAPSGVYLDADGTPVKANVATLVKLVTQKGRETQIKQGDFLFSFNIDVTR